VGCLAVEGSEKLSRDGFNRKPLGDAVLVVLVKLKARSKYGVISESHRSEVGVRPEAGAGCGELGAKGSSVYNVKSTQ
jgi:hypothetical protein